MNEQLTKFIVCSTVLCILHRA